MTAPSASALTDTIFGDQSGLRTARAENIKAKTQLVIVLTFLILITGIVCNVLLWQAVFA